jgi:hypothetical protein
MSTAGLLALILVVLPLWYVDKRCIFAFGHLLTAACSPATSHSINRLPAMKRRK